MMKKNSRSEDSFSSFKEDFGKTMLQCKI